MFYLQIFNPDFPIEVTHENGIIDTVEIFELRSSLSTYVPHIKSRDTIWVFGTIEFDGDIHDLERIGVVLGTQMDNMIIVKYPLSLLPIIDSIPSVKAIWPDSFVPTKGPFSTRLPIPLQEGISKSDMRKCQFPVSSFLIKVKDPSSIDLNELKNDLLDAFRSSGAILTLVSKCIYDDSVISFDSVMQFNILHQDMEFPIFIFEGPAKPACTEEIFRSFIRRNPHLGPLLEIHFMQ